MQGADPDDGSDPAIKLWITKVNQSDGFSSVLSLQSRTSDSTRIPVDVFVDNTVQTDPAGGVVKLATAPFVTDATVSEAVTAVKDIIGKTKHIGPVVSRLTPGPGISIVSANGDSSDGFYGPCQIVLEDSIASYGTGELVVLNGAREDYNNKIPSITFPKNKDSSIRLKMKLGSSFGSTKIRLMVKLYAPNGGVLPELTLSYRRIAATALGVTGTVPASDTAVPTAIDPSAYTLGAGGYVLMESVQLPLTGSAATDDIFYIEVSRAGSSDGYAYDMGLLETYYIFE